MKFVIVGLGSIGRRHQKNLHQLGHETIPCHRNDNLAQLLKQKKPDGVLVCNPTSLHVPASLQAVEAGCHVFIEKPISHNLNGVNQLLDSAKKKQLVLEVGYCLRFEPKLKKLKLQLEQKRVGEIATATIVAQSYLPDWHPGTDYQKSYSARKELGGGVLLDLSHEIDYAVWLFGKVKTIKAELTKSKKLGIETEAKAELKLVFKSGVKADILLDYLNKKHLRHCLIKGDKGSLSWDFKQIVKQGWDVNQMYIAEIKHFIKAVQGKELPGASGEQGRYVVAIVEAAKKSDKTKAVVKV